MTIQMTPDQIKEMNRDYRLQSDKPDYAGMYQYIFEKFGTQMNAINGSSEQSYWFQQAAQINSYLNNFVTNPEMRMQTFLCKPLRLEEV